jgi:hypothetical protein
MLKLQNKIYEDCKLNIPVIPHLEKHMGYCARMYEEDISICRRTLYQAAKIAPKEPQTLFWICHSNGIHCAAEQDVFIRDTTANHNSTSTFPRTDDEVHAFIVEVTGMNGKEVMGNVYKLNREAYAIDVRRFSQPALRAYNNPPSAYPLGCHAFPVNSAYLDAILHHQKECRAELAKVG